ncbi:NTP transferase domain-containing protein [Archangium sp.]|uniref:NTP transferase domain-containing protein n=1 Tax=Archangium sp. TaxID=1872627 RepID=UPI00286CE84F|nr:NTP transferase domain-containing protein [Archangium sp.]
MGRGVPGTGTPGATSPPNPWKVRGWNAGTRLAPSHAKSFRSGVASGDGERHDPTGAPGFSVVVLAAGGSSRLGSPKQLVRLAGEPLVCRPSLVSSRRLSATLCHRGLVRRAHSKIGPGVASLVDVHKRRRILSHIAYRRLQAGAPRRRFHN